MKTKKTNKRALAMSFVSMLLCVCMLVGTTFAWFTDSVTSANNIIKSGTLDVTFEWKDATANGPQQTYKDASLGAIFNNDLWEPGYVEAKNVKISNVGTLALKYQLNIIANDVVSELAKVIDVYYADGEITLTDRTMTGLTKIGTLEQVLASFTTTASGNLLARESESDPFPAHTVTLALKMQETAGNEYMDKSIGTDFSVQLMAAQLTSESDSFDEMYDENAAYFSATSDALIQGVPDPTAVLAINIETGHTPAAGETSWSIGDKTMCYLSANGETLTIASTDGNKVIVDSGLNGAFSAYPNATINGLENLDYGNVTDTTKMFSGNTTLTDATVAEMLSDMDLSNVSTTTRMFENCTGLVNVDLSGVDFSNVTLAGAMFAGCTNLVSVDLTGVDLSNVTVAGGMFTGCTNLESVNLTGVDLSNNTSFSAWFYNCASLTEIIGLSEIDTSNITNMNGMFSGCAALTELDLSGWDTSNVTDMAFMFNRCKELVKLNLSGFDVSNVTKMDKMFCNCSKLLTLNLGDWDMMDSVTVDQMIVNCPNSMKVYFADEAAKTLFSTKVTKPKADETLIVGTPT